MLRIATVNVRGLQDSRPLLLNIMQGKYGDPPHILVLTETKMTDQTAKRPAAWLKMLQRTHHIYHSTVPAVNSPQAGVTIAIQNSLTELGNIERAPIEAALHGFLLHLKIDTPASNPLHVVGVYCPPGYRNNSGTWSPIREQVQKECSRILANFPASHHTVMIAGDFNAVLQSADRLTASKCTGQDHIHQQFVANHQLHTVDPPPPRGLPRTATYRKLGGTVKCSHIDDIFTKNAAHSSPHARSRVADLQGTTTDHDMLYFETPFAALRMTPQPAKYQGPNAAAPRLKTPLPASTNLLLRTQIADTHGSAYSALHAETSTYVEQDVMPHWARHESTPADKPLPLTTLGGEPARQVIDRLGTQITTLLMMSDKTAQLCCPTVTPNAKSYQYFYPRTIARKQSRIIKQKKAIATRLRHALGHVNGACGTDAKPEPQSICMLNDKDEEVDELVKAHEATHPDATDTDALKAIRKELNRQQGEINREYTKLSAQEERHRVQKLMDEKQSAGNKQATGKWQAQTTSNLKVLQTEEGLISEPGKIKKHIESYYAPKLRAPNNGIKTGKYMPHVAVRDYPWDTEARFSTYKALLPVPREPVTTTWLHDAIDDEQMEMMTMALEDAHLFKQDIYLLQADMTEAFDTIDHDKLLMIMYDLGFPTDAIEVVKDLYTNARTTFQTPYGPTPALEINRGTIQGDSLSPFLFIIYLEPLLRWLKAGNKGYTVGALKSEGTDVQQHYQISDITYADDVNALTGGPTGLEDFKHQAAKISAYTTWGSLIANNSKTTVTGALHGSQPSMRIRQLMAMKRTDLHLLRNGKEEDNIPATNTLATTLATAMPQPGEWDTKLVQALHQLHSIGITTLESMMTVDRAHMRPAQDLKALVGSCKVKSKHLRAWNVLTHYLHTPQTQHHNKISATKLNNLDKANRAIDLHVLQSLKAIWPANPTAQPANILHLLLNIRERAEPMALQVRDEMADYIRKMMGRNRKSKGADVRRQPSKPYKRKRASLTGYQQYRRLLDKLKQGSQTPTTEDNNALLKLYTEYSHTPDEIITVTGLYRNTPQVEKGKRQHKKGPTQHQAMVTWASSLQPGWLMHVAQLLGYSASCAQPALPEDEACFEQFHRPYWKPRCEALERVTAVGTTTAKAQLAQLLAQQTAAARRPPPPRQSVPNAARTVSPCYPTGQLYDITIGQHQRKQLVIHPLPIKPHADIHATGKRKLTIRQIPQHNASPQDLLTTASWPERACLHQVDGRCTHLLDVATAAQLRARYLHVKTNHDKLFSKLNGGSFEEKLYSLVMRYSPGNIIHDIKIWTRGQQALPQALHDLLHNLIGSSTERLASPLNVAPSTDAYWSLHDRDRLFGANWNAYSVKWTGTSVVVPDHTDSTAITHAMQWAQQSARTAAAPTLTLLVLPAYGKSGSEAMRAQAAQQWQQRSAAMLANSRFVASSAVNVGGSPFVSTPVVFSAAGAGQHASPSAVHSQGQQQHQVQMMPGTTIGWHSSSCNGKGQRSTACLQLCCNIPPPTPHTSFLDTYKHEIGNRFNRCTTSRARRLMYNIISSSININMTPCKTRWLQGSGLLTSRRDPHPHLRFRATRRCSARKEIDNAPRRFRKLPTDSSVPKRTAGIAMLMHANDVTQAVQGAKGMLREVHGNPPGLRHDWRQFAYTDGSVISGKGNGEEREASGPGIGAAVHIPSNAQAAREAMTVAISCEYKDYDELKTVVNTINRAELAAIQIALEVAPQGAVRGAAC
eukprot:gene2516-biopygen4093